MQTRQADSLYLLDHVESQIIGSKLPSNGQALRVLFFNMRKVNLDLRSSAHLVIKEIEVFWQKARIPTKIYQHSIEKLEALYNEWKMLGKSCKRKSQLQMCRENEFLGKLNDLFDIAHADALQLMSIEEDRQFLIRQRIKGREGSMTGIDHVLTAKEERIARRQTEENVRRSKWQKEKLPGKQ